MEDRIVLNKVVKILKDFNTFNIDIDENTKLIEELGLDSITVIQFISLIENELQISINNNEINRNNFYDLKSFATYLKSKLNNKN